MRQDGLGVSSVPGYSSPQAVSLTKINIDENLTNSNLGVLKQTLWKLSSGISNCLSAHLPKDSYTPVPFLNIYILDMKPPRLSEESVIAG